MNVLIYASDLCNIKVIKLGKIDNCWHFCQHQNQNNTSLQCHSRCAQLKTSETITKKTDENFVKSLVWHGVSKSNNFN